MSDFVKIIASFLLFIFISFVAWCFDFYTIVARQQKRVVRFTEVIVIFLVFLLTQIILIPLFFEIYLSFQSGEIVDFNLEEIDLYCKTFLNISAMILAAFAVFMYSYLFFRKSHKAIWGDKKIKSFLLGVLSWLIVYPLIFFAGQTLSYILYFYFQTPQIEQVAVKTLREALNFPSLSILIFCAMVFFVPIVEEMLFRGYLQSWLRNVLSARCAIIITSAVFSLFHFSLSQGVSNLEFLMPLFILSCFLGFIYEKENSLLAPIGLHMIFNFVSVVIILIGWS